MGLYVIPYIKKARLIGCISEVRISCLPIDKKWKISHVTWFPSKMCFIDLRHIWQMPRVVVYECAFHPDYFLKSPLFTSMHHTMILWKILSFFAFLHAMRFFELLSGASSSKYLASNLLGTCFSWAQSCVKPSRIRIRLLRKRKRHPGQKGERV